MSESENNKRKVAWAVSIGLHVLLLLAFIFMVAWREPNPPYPEYGIEVNFGTSNVGSGEVQPNEPVNNSESEEEAQSEEISAEQESEEVIEEVAERQQETPVTEESEVIQQPIESPDVIKEEKEEVEKPVEPVPKKEETVENPKEKEPEQPKSPVVYQKKEGANGNTGENDSPKNNNQGDNPETVGDKGNPEGELDSRALYGNKGGGGGAPALKISGWYWDEIPNKKDASDENGYVEFSFVVDEEGYVGSIRVIQTTVSPSVVDFYKKQLQSTTFSQTNPNVAPLPQTRGTVKFIIKSR